MKTLIVNIETAWVGASEVVEVEIDDDATQEEIEAIAKETFQDYCSYGYHIAGEDDDIEE